jgi:hypothetical protein
MIKKAQVVRLTKHMDRMASALEASPETYGLTRKQALRYAYDLDVASDRLDRLVGRDAEKGHDHDHDDEEKDADVIDHDLDETYMPSFNESGPQDGMMDADEPYMDYFRDDTFDQLVNHSELTPGNSTPSGEDSSSEVDASGAWWMNNSDSDWRNW